MVAREILDDNATPGESRVAQLLAAVKERHDEIAFLYEPEIPLPGGGEREPDFVVVLPGQGVVVLEVKDWQNVLWGTKKSMALGWQGQQEKVVTNPARQAKRYMHAVMNRLQTEPRLLHPPGHYRAGRLRVPCQYLVVFSHLAIDQVTAFQEKGILPRDLVLTRADLDLSHPDRFLAALEASFKVVDWAIDKPLTAKEVDLVRRTLDPGLIIRDSAGREIGTVTQEQEGIIKESPGLRWSSLGKPGKKTPRVRIVRGVSGSGKTLVVIYRARHWARKLAIEPKILVMAHNLALQGYMHDQLVAYGVEVSNPYLKAEEILGDDYHRPIHTTGWIDAHFPNPGARRDLPRRFLDQEFEWLKNQWEQPSVARYQNLLRQRGEDAVTAEQAEFVLTAYSLYQAKQEEWRVNGERWMDWQDVLREALTRIRHPLHPRRDQYHMILIDEVQDFTPLGVQLALELLDPGGEIFLCEDPSQTLWRYYNWKEKGIAPRRATCTDLRVPYRCTYEINMAAFNLLYADPLLANSDGLIKPRFDTPDLIHGPAPLLVRSAHDKGERRAVRRLVEDYRRQGVEPHDIAVLCHTKEDLDQWEFLEGEGVVVNFFDKIKGLEYQTVILPGLHTAFDTDSNVDRRSFVSSVRRRIFVGMTRARQNLALTYQGELPIELSCLRGFTEEREG